MSDTLGFGISALDLARKSYAEHDELMVRTRDGMMHYKRPDGIITATIQDYTKSSLLNDLERNYSELVENMKDKWVTYHTVDLNGKNRIANSSTNSLDTSTFTVDSNCPNVFFRIHGSYTVDAVIGQTLALYEQAHPSTFNDTKDIIIYLNYNNTSIEVPVNYNELTAIDLKDSPIFSITGFKFNRLSKAYNELTAIQMANMKELDFTNSYHEVNIMDIIMAPSSLSTYTIIDEKRGVYLKNIFKI